MMGQQRPGMATKFITSGYSYRHSNTATFFQMPKKAQAEDTDRRSSLVIMGAGEINEFRNKVDQAKNTERITGAMRLVAAAKVRRAQAAVL